MLCQVVIFYYLCTRNWQTGVCEPQAVNICRFIKIKDIGYWTALCAYRTPQTAIGKSLSNNTISTLKIYHD